MKTLTQLAIFLLASALLSWTAPAGADPIDVVAAGPKVVTEPVETNTDTGLESPTRATDYTLEAFPTNESLPELEFVSPGAGGSGHAARITARAGQAGLFTRRLPADKGQRITFSVKLRAEGIQSVQLVAMPLPRRPVSRPRPPGAPARPRPGVGGGAPRPAAPPQGGPLFQPRRSKPVSGSFGWRTLRLDTSFTGNIDEALFQVAVRGPGAVWIDDFSVAVHWPKRVAIPEKPAAPLLMMVLMHSETPRAYITNRQYFQADATKYEEMAKMLNRYGARLTIQPEREFWLGAQKYDPDFLRRMHAKYGVSFSVHTHGPNPRTNPTRKDVLDYIKLRKDEMEAMGSGPVTDLNGNFDQEDWDMFADAGIRSMTAYKNVRTQMGLFEMDHFYLHPWHPAGSPYQGEAVFARHRPGSRVVFLPGDGALHTRHHDRFAALAERCIRVALSRVRADRVNVFYIVEHVGRFVSHRRGQSPLEYVRSQDFRDDLELHEKLYRDFLAPLVEAGYIHYVIPPEAREKFEQWEQKMGVAARP